MQYVWPYLSIWNTLHQSRYTVLWQRGQRSPRSGSSNLCSKETGDVTPSAEQRCEARLRSVRGSTLQVCTLNTVLFGRGNSVINWRVHREPPRPTGELTSPHLHSHMHGLSPCYDSAPGEREAARNRKSFYPHEAPSPVSSPANPECDYRRNWLRQNNLVRQPPPPPLHIHSSEGVTHAHTHTQSGETGCSRILYVILSDSNSILMEHRCLLGAAVPPMRRLHACFSRFNPLMIIVYTGNSPVLIAPRCGSQTKLQRLKWWESSSPPAAT